MTLIHVPRLPKNAFDPNRPVSALLRAQIEYLHDAERRLPLRYRSEVYINAIKTEGEAAKYIREVTEAIHDAHAEAMAARVRVPSKRKRMIEIAAVADERAERKRVNQVKKRSRQKPKGKSGPKKKK
jgi:glyceraldehyde-3-phosphate dehydrogenase/erythrose-4-phosphate dehydrogenase